MAATVLLAITSAALAFALLLQFSWIVAFLVAAFILVCIVTLRRSVQRGRNRVHPSL